MRGGYFLCRASFVVLFAFALVGMCFGQSYWKRDFGPGVIYQMLPESGGDFQIVRQSGDSLKIITATLGGDTASTETYGEPNSVFTSVLPTPDCQMILVGQKDNKGRLVKTVTGNDTAWTRTFPDSNSYFSTVMYAGTGYNYLFAGGANGKAWLVNIQSTGDVLWKKTYGVNPSGFTSIYAADDGNYLLPGNTRNSAWLIKINGDGDTLWTRDYADSTSGFQSILPASDGNFLLPGFCKGKAWLVKIKPNGDTVWTKTYGNGDSYLNSVLNTSDGNYIVAGQQSDQVHSRPLVMKIKPNGDTIWTKTYMDNAHTITFVSSGDGNYLLSGITTNGPDQNCWIMSIIDDQYAYKNQPFTFTIPAGSSEAAGYVYTPIKAPAGMTLGAEGTISWSPATDSVYVEHVEYLRKDNANKKDTLKFNIYVNAPSASSKRLFQNAKIDSKRFDIMTAPSSHTVKFLLPADCSAVYIYDIMGKIVQRIEPIISNSGSFVIMNGSAAAGGNMASGKYFAGVSYGKNLLVKPFLFVR